MTQPTTTPAKGFVILHYGDMPIDALAKAQKILPRDAVIDTNLARVAGASFAFGAPGPIAALWERLEADAVERVARSHPHLSPDARRWLAVGQQGISSSALFQHLTCGEPITDRSTPRDLDDFGRCKRMLEAVPELRARLSAVTGDLPPVWGRLAAAWAAIESTLDEELATGRREAPQASALLAQALKG